MIFYWLQRYGLHILSEKGNCIIGMLVNALIYNQKILYH